MSDKLPVSQPPSIRIVNTMGDFWRVIVHGPDNLQEQDDRPRFCEMDVAVAWTKEEALALAVTWFGALQGWRSMVPAPDSEFILGSWLVGPVSEVGELCEEGGAWWDINGEQRQPTHWMPLPAPPAPSEALTAAQGKDK